MSIRDMFKTLTEYQKNVCIISSAFALVFLIVTFWWILPLSHNIQFWMLCSQFCGDNEQNCFIGSYNGLNSYEQGQCPGVGGGAFSRVCYQNQGKTGSCDNVTVGFWLVFQLYILLTFLMLLYPVYLLIKLIRTRDTGFAAVN
eukprot:TRINITY_DN26105_c0_g1_i1.p1 TRINITY_DN26105_c0_g1~~TRINITY_DN26105_c0_g1_i1.p1  ORF type:complete len:164 (-),score=1.44 TRINITY_DN26105_c0_g1_i1:75-503(-)